MFTPNWMYNLKDLWIHIRHDYHKGSELSTCKHFLGHFCSTYISTVFPLLHANPVLWRLLVHFVILGKFAFFWCSLSLIFFLFPASSLCCNYSEVCLSCRHNSAVVRSFVLLNKSSIFRYKVYTIILCNPFRLHWTAFSFCLVQIKLISSIVFGSLWDCVSVSLEY